MNSGNAIFFSVLVCHFLEQGLNIMFLMPFFFFYKWCFFYMMINNFFMYVIAVGVY